MKHKNVLVLTLTATLIQGHFCKAQDDVEVHQLHNHENDAILSQNFVNQAIYFKASNTDEEDRFGESLAASGNTFVVGTTDESSSASGVNGDQTDNSLPASGSAYVFVNNGDTWSQQAYLKASNPRIGYSFAEALDISGDTIVIGSPNESSNATGIDGDQNNDDAPLSGAAYVFVRDGDNWSQQAYVKASNTNQGSFFGHSVSIDGDTMVIGSVGESSNATGVNGDQNNDFATSSGAVYVFTRDNDVWSQQAYIKASNTNSFDRFGESVDISGDTIIVSAIDEDSNAQGIDGDQDDNSADTSGAAYVFTRENGQWSQQAYIKASNTESGDEFGQSVSLFNDTLAVGAGREDSSATGINGDQDDNNDTFSGAVYVFTRTNDQWDQQAYVKSSNTQSVDRFGEKVSLANDLLMVGSVFEDSNATGINGDQNDNSASIAGAAYVFSRSGNQWSQLAYVKASNTELGDRFSSSLAISASGILIAAMDEGSADTGIDGDQGDNSATDSGAVYLYPFSPDLIFSNHFETL